MTDEEKAIDYAQTECCNSCTDFCKNNVCKMFCNVRNAVLYGLAECKPKWHDLRKDPNDLPEEGIEVLVLYSNTYDDNGLVLNKHTLRYELAQYINDEDDLTEWYWVESGSYDMVHEVIAWCELPKVDL